MNQLFSIQPWESVGFTDQLLQFDSFYKLGRSLGWNYHHLDFSNQRSSPRIYEFLGINDYLAAVWNARNGESDGTGERQRVDISLGDNELEIRGISSLRELQDHVVLKAEALSSELDTGKSPIFCLSLEKGSSRRFFALVQKAIRDLPDQLDFRKALTEYGQFQDKPNALFEDRRLKILVHMRLGDTAYLKTPWNTYLYLKSETTGRKRLSQLDRIEDEQNFIEPGHYLKVVKMIRSILPEDDASMLFFSDGYGRIIDAAIRSQGRLRFSSEQVKALRLMRETYDEDQFQQFEPIPGTRLLIGENDENLFNLIGSALDADLIIVGRVQRLIPKFLALYPRREAPQKVLVLCKGNRQPKYMDLGHGDGRKASFTVLPVEASDLRRKISEAIACLSADKTSN